MQREGIKWVKTFGKLCEGEHRLHMNTKFGLEHPHRKKQQNADKQTFFFFFFKFAVHSRYWTQTH